MHDVFFERDLSIYSSPCLLRSLSRGDLRSDFFDFYTVWSLVLHGPSTFHRNFVVFDSLSYVDRMDRPRRWILLYLESLELLIDFFLHFDTRPHHNVQIVNFYMWHILFADFFDLRTSQLLIFKFVDWKYREVVISWDLVVPLSWICKSRDCWNPSSFFFHFSLNHFQTSCSDMSVRIWCYVQQEHPAADHQKRGHVCRVARQSVLSLRLT